MNLDASMMPAIALIASINDVKTTSAANVSLTFPVSASDKLHRSINRYNERQLPPTRARGHRTDGPKANHALTFNLDHSSGADLFEVLNRATTQRRLSIKVLAWDRDCPVYCFRTYVICSFRIDHGWCKRC